MAFILLMIKVIIENDKELQYPANYDLWGRSCLLDAQNQNNQCFEIQKLNFSGFFSSTSLCKRLKQTNINVSKQKNTIFPAFRIQWKLNLATFIALAIAAPSHGDLSDPH